MSVFNSRLNWGSLGYSSKLYLELTPVILATQEAEIRRIKVRSHPGQIVWKTLSLKTKKGLLE
jgi:hypothetical protein